MMNRTAKRWRRSDGVLTWHIPFLFVWPPFLGGFLRPFLARFWGFGSGLRVSLTSFEGSQCTACENEICWLAVTTTPQGGCSMFNSVIWNNCSMFTVMDWWMDCARLFLDYPFVFEWFRIKRSADPESAERREPMGRRVGCRNVGRADGRMCEGFFRGPRHTPPDWLPYVRYYVPLT